MRLLLPLLAVGGLAAADTEHRLRLTFQGLPTDYEVDAQATLGGFTVTGSDQDSYDSAGRLAIGYSARFASSGPVAFILGAGVAFSGSERNDLTVREFGVWIEPGVSIRLAPWFDLEAGIQLGAGVGKAEQNGDDLAKESYGEFTLLIRPVITIAPGIQLFAELGYMGRSQHFEDDENGIDVEADVDVAGVTGSIGIGVRF